MSILIVDDSLVSRTFISNLLVEAGYTDLILCESAEEAYLVVGLNDPSMETRDIDLILLDTDLPGKSGIDACHDFSTHPLFRDVPVIIISETDLLEGLEAAFSAGAIDYLTKPPNHIELLARVRSALRLKEAMNLRKKKEDELLILNEKLAEANRGLERLSVTDSLTGLPNRRSFNQFLNKEWLREQRGKQPFSVIMIDIDHFKAFNDHYGHLEGDVCLQKVASVLQGGFCRAGDLLTRYGGEEFVAILPYTDAQGACELAESLHERIKSAAIAHAASPVAPILTISIGIASVIPSQDITPEEVVAMADEALYQAKAEGRNRSIMAASTEIKTSR